MPKISPTISLALKLIAEKSVTPQDQNCQEIIANLLQQNGFNVQFMPFGEVKNIYATHGTENPVLCFAGHTDVVPAGDETAWQYPPFEPKIIEDTLYGRGSADMKGSLAAMICAGINFVKQNPKHLGTLSFLLTSDEEGEAIYGTKYVVEQLRQNQTNINYCVVGEPSSSKVLGDVIKNGRRGSLSGTLTIYGKQGHVAYPHLACNPIHLALPFLTSFSQIIWDQGDAFFPPTSLQIIDISTENKASNVIPAEIQIRFNWRFSPKQTPEILQNAFHKLCQQFKFDYSVNWNLSGLPFITEPGDLLDVTILSTEQVMGITPKLSTSGGTSDGRFIATLPNCQVIELGPINQTIHQTNECVSVNDLNNLTLIYQNIMEKLLS